MYRYPARYMAIEPAPPLDEKGQPRSEQRRRTDGVNAWKNGGRKLTGMEAAETIRADFERAAAKLPFRATGGVFFQTLKLDDKTYRLYAIDSGWLDPRGREVTLRVLIPGRVQLCDLLIGQPIAVRGGAARLTVPAGTFCVRRARTASRCEIELRKTDSGPGAETAAMGQTTSLGDPTQTGN
jgi:hypothetical protein